MEQVDVVVVGAGFGGLASALTLAEEGARVVVLETLGYPGGCASTFERRGYRFESGATLFSGFSEGQRMDRWIRRYGLHVEHQVLNPVVELRTPGWRLAVPSSREALVERFCAFPDAPRVRIEAFFREQAAVADTLWKLFSQPQLLPPFGPRELLRHAAALPRYLPLLRLLGRPLAAVVERHGLSSFEPLVTYLDATCQITVQAGSAEAEAPFALAAMDYYFRGTGHLHGGVGRLADGLVEAIESCGGSVRFYQRCGSLRREGRGWTVESRRGSLRARAVVANLLPAAVEALVKAGGGTDFPQSRRLAAMDSRVREGWGASMLYLAFEPTAVLPEDAFHLELIPDASQSFVEGHHLFCSVSGAGEKGRTPRNGRTATVSTHVPMKKLMALDGSERARYVEAIQQRMRDGLQHLAPELWAVVEREWPASPRTFERFTGRPDGFVGGIPRRAGLSNYRGLWPKPILPGLYLVGDTVFPGQSTLATALGGERVSRILLKSLSREGRTWPVASRD